MSSNLDTRTGLRKGGTGAGEPVRDVSFRRPLLLLFVVGYCILHIAVVALGVSPVLQGELVDTDAYTRVVRAERLITAGDWYDGTDPRANAPWGESSHWTRPLDVALVAVAAPLLPFTGTRTALFLAAVVLPPLFGLALCLAVAWLAAHVVPRKLLPLVPVAVLAQPMVAAYTVAGRIDHHLPIVLLFVVALGFLLRALAAPPDRRSRPALLAGVLAAGGLWISTEFLAPLALFHGCLVLHWILRGDDEGEAGAAFNVGLLSTAAVAMVLEHGIRDLAVVEYDRFSLPHLTAALISAGFFAVVRTWRSRLDGVRGRAAAAAVAALLAALAMRLGFPSFFGGPFVAVDAATAELWLRHVTELHQLLPGSGGAWSEILLYIGAALVAVPWFAIRTWHAPEPRARVLRAILLAGAVLFLLLALFQRRWSLQAEVLIAIGLVGAVGDGLARLQDSAAPHIRAARALLVGAALIGFPMAGAALEGRAGRTATASGGPASSCDVRNLANALPRVSERRVILAMMDFGPELLYRTPHDVVATPYHRNPGIVASHRILGAEPERAETGIRERGIDWIVLCPPRDRGFFAREAESGEPSLHQRLTRDAPPPWIERLALPGLEGSAFQVFQVRR